MFTIRTYVVKTPRHTVLADTCFGNDKTRKTLAHGHMRKDPYLERLAAAGVKPEQVDYVFCTHLHLDHVGWNTRLENGRWVPTFPRARYLFGKKEWEHWSQAPATAFNHDAIQDSVRPIVEAGRAVMVDSGHAIEDGMEVIPLPGHTPGHAGLRLKSQGKQAVMTGDMMHHALQVCEPKWDIGVATLPDLSVKVRTEFLRQHADTDVLVLAAHFPPPKGVHVVSKNKGFRVKVNA